MDITRIALDPARIPPQNLFIEYGFGDYGAPVLLERGDELIFQELPPLLSMEVFFDYSPLHGLMAFGQVFWSAAGDTTSSVTDLWVYDFETDQLSQWFSGNVGRAAWSSDPTQPPTLIVAAHNGETFDLVLAQDENATLTVVEDISPYFSWAPGQSRVAYVKDGRLETINPLTQVRQVTNATAVYEEGWIGDAPVWDLDNDALIFAENPIVVAFRSIAGGSFRKSPAFQDAEIRALH